MTHLPSIFSTDPDLVRIFHYAMNFEDKSAIVNFLIENHYIKENEALARQLSERNQEIDYKDQEIETLQDALALLTSELNALRNTYHILVDRDGRQALFRRDENNIFYEIPEEPLSSVRRRLNFDEESTVDDDELMERLMFGTP